MSHVQVLGKCSICGGRVTCPAGPIGYAGPLEDLISCESCGARKATGPVIEMERPDAPHVVCDVLRRHGEWIRRNFPV